MSLHKVTLTQILKGQRIQNVFYLQNIDGLRSDTDIGAHLIADWIQFVKTCQGTQLRYINLMVQRLGTNPPAPFILNIDIPGTWTGHDPRMPFVCLVMQKKTNIGGRRGRGRYYISGVNPEELQTDGAWSTGTISGRFQPMCDNLKSRWLSGGSVAGLRLMNGPADAQLETDVISVTNLIPRNFPGLQRRRSVGVGM